MCQEWILLFFKKNIPFPTYFHFSDFLESKLQNLWRHHSHYFTLEDTLSIVQRNNIIKIKFGLIMVQITTNIPNLFLALLWRIKTTSRLFDGANKIAIWCNLLHFCGCWIFLNFHSAHLEKYKKSPSHHDGFWLLTMTGFCLIVIGRYIKKCLNI